MFRRPNQLAGIAALLVASTLVSLSTAGAKSPGWSTLPPGLADGRTFASVIWTGKELIVWGGEAGSETKRRNDGAAHRPRTGRWRKLSAGPLAPRSEHLAVWTGREMVVWGGATNQSRPVNDAAAYNPRRDRWRKLPEPPIDAAAFAVGAWTGDEVIVWGGSKQGGLAPGDGGAAYDPRANRWRRIAESPLDARTFAGSVWTGRELLIWGGRGIGNAEHRNGGAAYDPERDTWRTIGNAPFPSRTEYTPILDRELTLEAFLTPSAVWTGKEMIVWGLLKSFVLGTPNRAPAASYDPVSDRWRELASPPIDFAEDWDGIGGERAIWVGDAMVAWTGNLDRGGPQVLRYDPGTDAWARLPAPPPVDDHFPILHWTGSKLIVWGSDMAAIAELP